MSSIAPPTLNRSVMELPRSALPCICSRVRPTSRLPTQREASSRIGNIARHSSVTCQDSASIATPTTTTLIMLETVLRQGRRERPLRADHVVVEPGHQRTGLGAGEERQRHPLHVREDRGAEVEDQPLPDAGGQPAHRRARARRRRPRHRRRPARASTTSAASCFRMPSSTMPLDQQRGDDHEGGVDDREDEEEPDRPAVRPGEAERPGGPCRGRASGRRCCGRCACAATPVPCRNPSTSAHLPLRPLVRSGHSPISDASSRKRRTCASRSASRWSSRSSRAALCSSALVAVTAP